MTAIVFLLRSPTNSSDTLPAMTLNGNANSPLSDSETPNKNNVSHDYRVRVARLRDQLEASPEDTTALLSFASLQLDAHEISEAAAAYERYLALNPGNRQAWLDLTNCYAQIKEWHNAEKTIRRMLGRHPDDPAAMYNLGAVYANQGRTDDAISWWKKTRDQQIDIQLSDKATAALAQLAPTQ